MRTLYPGHVVAEDSSACKAELGVKRTEPGDCAAGKIDKLPIRAAERLKVSINSASGKGCQDGIVRGSTRAAISWAIKNSLDTVAAKAQLINHVGSQI